MVVKACNIGRTAKDHGGDQGLLHFGQLLLGILSIGYEDTFFVGHLMM